MKAFKAYDIRGVYNRDWNADDAYKIGYFLPRLLKTKDVLVGRDIRLSSDEIYEALTQGINHAGANVHNLGLCTTPFVYWATAQKKFKGSVQITASHNPKEHNGLKVSGENALPIGYDAGLYLIDEWMKTEEIHPEAISGEVFELDLRKEYLDFQNGYFEPQAGLRVLIDNSNGMSGLFIEDIFGNNADYINLELDGTFPNHDPNPLNLKNVKQLSDQVKAEGYDLGIIFDGDADRVMFVDENGEFISPDLMIAVLGEYFLKDKKEYPVIQDIRTSRSVAEHLVPLGAIMHVWRVGRAFASPKLKEIEGLFGGELAGHYYFRDFYYSDSGILASILIYRIISAYKAKGVTVSQMISVIKKYENSGEINYTVENKSEVMNLVVEHFVNECTPDSVMDFDGFRLDYPDYWINIRPSNTEPYLRFIAEAKSKAKLAEIVDTVNQIIRTSGSN